MFARNVAEIGDGGEEPSQYVRYASDGEFHPAVTLAIAKRKGTNAVDVAARVLRKIEPLRGTVIPSDVTLSITWLRRNRGGKSMICCST